MEAPVTKNRILIIRGGDIGDFILTFPVFRALRELFPDTRLEAIAYPRMGELALAGGLIHAYRSIESRALAGFFARRGPVDEEMAAFFGEFALIISFLFDPDLYFESNVRRSTKAQFLACPHRPMESEGIHAVDALLKPLERLAIFGTDPVPRLNLQKVHCQEWTPGTWITLHPGSGNEWRNWPERQWHHLIDRIVHETDWNTLLIGGNAESERLERLWQSVPEGRGRLIGRAELTFLGTCLQQTSAYVGHDSGISHLSAALGLPSLILWGSSNFEVWRPLGDHVRFIHKRDLQSIEVEEVFHSLTTMLRA